MNKNEHPILFSTPMVQAILEGRKTQTRRVIKNKGFQWWVDVGFSDNAIKNTDNSWIDVCPYKVGMTLWVRETWCRDDVDNGGETVYYKADYTDRQIKDLFTDLDLKWKPSIHMPRSAARLFLTVKSVRVERLQEITDADAVAEGCIDYKGIIGDLKFEDVLEYEVSARNSFAELWDSIYLKTLNQWQRNPWVFVTEFEGSP